MQNTRKNEHENLKKTVLAAMFLALAYVLPFLTGQIPEIGKMLCPMHIPVLLCGFICGWQFGLGVGIVAPLLRSLTLGMPVFFPSAVAMAVELGAYGLIAAVMHAVLPKKKPFIYCSLLAAMIGGRLIHGAANFILYGAIGKAYTLSAFIAGSLTNAIPGIIIQIVFIPPIVMIYEKPTKENETK